MTLKAFALSALVSIVAGLVVAAVLISLVGCKVGGGQESACEQLSPSGVCGTVYQCARRVDGERIELCIRLADLELAEQENGPCSPSRDERFSEYATIGVDPPCFWCCAGECSTGANAKNGTFCEGAL